MHIGAREAGRKGVLFADAERAFPSVYTEFYEVMLILIGAPEWFLGVVRRAFRRVTHELEIAGMQRSLGVMTIGVAQGNALSAFLFIIVYQGLLWKLQLMLLSSEMVIGYADDVAVALECTERLKPVLVIFYAFGALSGCFLNMSKSLWVACEMYTDEEKNWATDCTA